MNKVFKKMHEIIKFKGFSKIIHFNTFKFFISLKLLFDILFLIKQELFIKYLVYRVYLSKKNEKKLLPCMRVQKNIL